MTLPLLPFVRVARFRVAPVLLASAALLLGACSTPRPGQNVPQPPLLAGVGDAPAPAATSSAAPSMPAGGATGSAPPGLAQTVTVQDLLARSDVSVRLIDAGRAQDLRAWVAPFLLASGQRDRILADIAQSRAVLGPIQGRSRPGARGIKTVRLGSESQMPPPGLYANVEYTAQRLQGGTAIERLSFRQESDGWRFTGYTAQVVPQEPAPSPAEPDDAASARR